jgi:Kef-type K+ transport system membrane component KefB
LDILLKIGVVLIVGFIGGRIAKHFRLPSVSGYLIVGLFLGPSFFHLFTETESRSLTFISEFALAFIAFSIGSEFVVKDMIKVGKSVAIITLTEVLGAVIVVFFIMYFLCRQPFVFSIVIASMSAATAPAATLLVMRQYRAHGPVTNTLLPVVALDDVYGIIAFGLAMAIAKLSLNANGVSLVQMILGPMKEIFGSFLLGGIIGLILTFIAKKFTHTRDEVQVVAFASIVCAMGLSKWLGLSPLLTNIVSGTVLVNMMKNSNRVFSSVNDLTSPFYLLFFTLAGASLNLSILANVGMVGVAYIFARASGKIFGCWVGAKWVKAEKTVQKYMGLGLLPQGGISIGLSVLVHQQLPASMRWPLPQSSCSVSWFMKRPVLFLPRWQYPKPEKLTAWIKFRIKITLLYRPPNSHLRRRVK